MSMERIFNILKFIFGVLFFILIIFFFCSGLNGPEFKERQEIINSEHTIESDIFEQVASDINNSGIILRFKYNDTLYFYYKSGYGVGLTQMYDVDGLPLTYQKYLQN